MSLWEVRATQVCDFWKREWGEREKVVDGEEQKDEEKKDSVEVYKKRGR